MPNVSIGWRNTISNDGLYVVQEETDMFALEFKQDEQSADVPTSWVRPWLEMWEEISASSSDNNLSASPSSLLFN